MKKAKKRTHKGGSRRGGELGRCKETREKNEAMEIKKSQLVEMVSNPSESHKDLCFCVQMSVHTACMCLYTT